MSTTQRTSRIAAFAALAALTLTAGACAPGGGSGSGSGGGSDSPASPKAGATDVAAMGDVELILWDQEVREGQASQFSQLVDAFKAEYPNIAITRVEQSFEDLSTTLALALTDPNPPDIVQANNSRADMGAFVGAGQLTSLEPYAAAYGWRDRFPETVLKNMTYSPDGKSFGSGELYGLPQAGEIVGVFYNRAKLTALGLEAPATWDEFNAALEAAKAAGEVPLMLGDVEGWPAAHVFGPIQGAHVPADQITALGMGNPGVAWTTPENLAAATELADWVKAGYFNEGFTGADYDAVVEEFANGTGVFLMAGSWVGAVVDEAMGANGGFFAPAPTAGAPVATTGGTSLPFAITAGSAHPDAAAAFIDFITNDEAMKVLAATGNLPVLNAKELIPQGSAVWADVFTAFAEVSETGALLPYLDWATPTFGDEVLKPGLQDLMADKVTPQGLLDKLQADYAAFTAQ
jgi:raffinose/stachyose/melibiose transport system substrate-binding protein